MAGIDAKIQLQSTNASRHEELTGELNAEAAFRMFLISDPSTSSKSLPCERAQHDART